MIRAYQFVPPCGDGSSDNVRDAVGVMPCKKDTPRGCDAPHAKCLTVAPIVTTVVTKNGAVFSRKLAKLGVAWNSWHSWCFLVLAETK